MINVLILNTPTIIIVGFRIRIQLFNYYDLCNNNNGKKIFLTFWDRCLVLEVLKLNYQQLPGYHDRVRNSAARATRAGMIRKLHKIACCGSHYIL